MSNFFVSKLRPRIRGVSPRMAAPGICLEKKVSELFKIRETCCLNDIPALYKSAHHTLHISNVSHSSLLSIVGVSIHDPIKITKAILKLLIFD